MMVNFMYQLIWTIEYSVILLNIILHVSMKVFWDEINI